MQTASQHPWVTHESSEIYPTKEHETLRKMSPSLCQKMSMSIPHLESHFVKAEFAVDIACWACCILWRLSFTAMHLQCCTLGFSILFHGTLGIRPEHARRALWWNDFRDVLAVCPKLINLPIAPFEYHFSSPILSFNFGEKKLLKKNQLVGGWTNPFEKYEHQNGLIFPRVPGEVNKNIWV